MAVIYSNKGNFLLLRTNPKFMNVDVWFVVTGSIEGKEGEENAVRREVMEETGLKILNIKPTDYFCIYECPKGTMNHEKAFIVKVKEETPKLSVEHTDYKWLTKQEFLKQLDWDKNIDPEGKFFELIKDI